jgi:hypothetical protein
LTINKPSLTDILRGFELIRTNEWVDPSEWPEELCWVAEAYMPDGRRASDGVADTTGEAMALAWINSMAPDALQDGIVTNVPLVVPEGWRFELTPPVDDHLAPSSK